MLSKASDLMGRRGDNMAITCEKVVENFIAGLQEGEKGSVSSTKTVRIKGTSLSIIRHRLLNAWSTRIF